MTDLEQIAKGLTRGCPCYRCVEAQVHAKPASPHELVLGVDPRMMRMFLCKSCRNKRCPHAADHRNACTGSNEVGQPGSLYPRNHLLEKEQGR